MHYVLYDAFLYKEQLYEISTLKKHTGVLTLRNPQKFCTFRRDVNISRSVPQKINTKTVTLTSKIVGDYQQETPNQKSIPYGFRPVTRLEVAQNAHFHFRFKVLNGKNAHITSQSLLSRPYDQNSMYRSPIANRKRPID
jgi:hypothetical protein